MNICALVSESDKSSDDMTKQTGTKLNETAQTVMVTFLVFICFKLWLVHVSKILIELF